MRKLTTKIFIERAQKIHEDKYDYSKVYYITNKIKVEIICPIHGSFLQQPNNHMNGIPCPKCGYEKRAITKTLDTKCFIKKSKILHGNKYDYSKSKYINTRSRIEIICPIHGGFWMLPSNHLQGCICFKCSRLQASKKTNKNTEYFLQKSLETHGITYDYSKSKYINARTKIEIICRKHGSFWQIPTSHYDGIGCPFCASSKGEQYIEKILQNNNIQYVYQKKFSECIHKNTLPFDFYLPNHNICIEYDGEQHFEPINIFGGEKTFLKNKKHDKIKNVFCYENNIKLIRIPYWEKDNINIHLSCIFQY